MRRIGLAALSLVLSLSLFTGCKRKSASGADPIASARGAGSAATIGESAPSNQTDDPARTVEPGHLPPLATAGGSAASPAPSSSMEGARSGMIVERGEHNSCALARAMKAQGRMAEYNTLSAMCRSNGGVPDPSTPAPIPAQPSSSASPTPQTSQPAACNQARAMRAAGRLEQYNALAQQCRAQGGDPGPAPAATSTPSGEPKECALARQLRQAKKKEYEALASICRAKGGSP